MTKKLNKEALYSIVKKLGLDTFHSKHKRLNFTTLTPAFKANSSGVKIHKSYIGKGRGSEYYVMAKPLANGTYDIYYVRKSDHYGKFLDNNWTIDGKVYNMQGDDYDEKTNTYRDAHKSGTKQKVGYVKVGNIDPNTLERSSSKDKLKYIMDEAYHAYEIEDIAARRYDSARRTYEKASKLKSTGRKYVQKANQDLVNNYDKIKEAYETAKSKLPKSSKYDVLKRKIDKLTNADFDPDMYRMYKNQGTYLGVNLR